MQRIASQWRPFVFLLIISTARSFQPGKRPLVAQRTDKRESFATICLTRNSDDGPDSRGEISRMQTWNPLRLAVLRLGLTEPMGTSPLNYGQYNGNFSCAHCGQLLFDSKAKYDSGSGWPSFWRSAQEGAVSYERDMGRLECQCARCKSHLGHVFLDGPRPTTVEPSVFLASPGSDPRGQADNSPLPRFCINGAAIKYEQRGDKNKYETEA